MHKTGREGVEVKTMRIVLSLINSRITMKIQLKICLQVLFFVWFNKVLQDVAAGTNSTSSSIVSSVSDANLMFEFLLEGLDFDQDNNIIVPDEELASMRVGRTFLSHINSNIPKSLKAMEHMVTNLKKRKPLTQTKFETLVLSMVYSAHLVGYQEKGEKQEAWGEVLRQLVNVTVFELRGNYLFNYA